LEQKQKERQKEYQKKYIADGRHKLTEHYNAKIECACGFICPKTHHYRHLKNGLHKKNMEIKTNPNYFVELEQKQKERQKEYQKKYMKKKYHEQEQTICECGGCYIWTNKYRHLKTKKHQKYIKKQKLT